jgi:hypothetical protein
MPHALTGGGAALPGAAEVAGLGERRGGEAVVVELPQQACHLLRS